MSNCNRFQGWILLVFILCLFGGCGDGRAKRVPISGVVTVDGTPLAFGSVTFLPESVQSEASRAGGGSLNENGEFKISSFTPNDGLMPGKYSVMILALEPISETSQRWHAPKKYSSVETSGLTIDITEKTDNVAFDLSWEGEEQNAPFVETF